jgi:hypothetical protein
LEKSLPNFWKNGQNSCQTKKAKKSTSKLNLKVQNIYIKPLLKPSPCFETAHLGKYVKNAFEKVAQIVPFFGPHTTQKGTWVLKT